MKRVGGLYEKICSFPNLIVAGCKAVKGKKRRFNASRFYFHMEFDLLDIQKELLEESFRPRGYDCFDIFEPKRRHVCAAAFKERVVHHAIMEVLGPYFERWFIFDSYACRREKGVQKAVRRARSFCRKSAFFFKTDVKKYSHYNGFGGALKGRYIQAQGETLGSRGPAADQKP